MEIVVSRTSVCLWIFLKLKLYIFIYHIYTWIWGGIEIWTSDVAFATGIYFILDNRFKIFTGASHLSGRIDTLQILVQGMRVVSNSIYWILELRSLFLERLGVSKSFSMGIMELAIESRQLHIHRHCLKSHWDFWASPPICLGTWGWQGIECLLVLGRYPSLRMARNQSRLLFLIWLLGPLNRILLLTILIVLVSLEVNYLFRNNFNSIRARVLWILETVMLHGYFHHRQFLLLRLCEGYQSSSILGILMLFRALRLLGLLWALPDLIQKLLRLESCHGGDRESWLGSLNL